MLSLKPLMMLNSLFQYHTQLSPKALTTASYLNSKSNQWCLLMLNLGGRLPFLQILNFHSSHCCWDHFIRNSWWGSKVPLDEIPLSASFFTDRTSLCPLRVFLKPQVYLHFQIKTSLHMYKRDSQKEV